MPKKPKQYRPGNQRQPKAWGHRAHADKRLTGRALQERNNQIKTRDRYQCQNKRCSLITTELQVDHKVPLSSGGTDDWDNLQSLCEVCHSVKSRIESHGRRLPNPSDFPLTYEEAKLEMVKNDDGEDDGEWGDLMGLYGPGGTHQ